MATVWQHFAPAKATVRGKTKWVVDLRRAGGGRHFFGTFDEAQKFAGHKAQEVRDYGREATALTHTVRVAFLRATERLAKLGASIDDALDFYERHHSGAGAKPLSEALDEFWRAKAKAGRRARYVDSLRNTIGHFVRWCRDRHQIEQVCQCTQQLAEQWLTSNGWEPITQAKYRGTLSIFFQWCVRRRYAAVNPCADIERVIVDAAPPGILTVAQCRTLLRRALEPQNRRCIAWLAVQLFGGLRPREANVLTMSEVGSDHIEVQARKSKTRQRRIVTINPTLKAWLKLGGDLPLRNSASWLLRLRYDHPDGKTISTKSKREELTEVVPWSHDCLRHSFVSYHFARYQNAAKTAAEAGHTEDMLFRHYRELVTPREARKFWGLTPGACSARSAQATDADVSSAAKR